LKPPKRLERNLRASEVEPAQDHLRRQYDGCLAIRVGIDLVAVEDVRESISNHGERYLKRVFTAAERADCAIGEAINPARLAARYAAKEAAFKVLDVGDHAVSWQDVEVKRDQRGSVTLCLRDRALKLAEAAGLGGFAVSLTHERGLAGAVVVAEISTPADT
jgi:holo-[acyl-carrier protein] synthase